MAIVHDNTTSDNFTCADTEFTLTGSITSNQSDYYDGSNVVTCRVYQQAI